MEHNPALSLMNKLGAAQTQDVNNNFSEAKLDELVRVADLFIAQYGEKWTASYSPIGVIFYPWFDPSRNIDIIVNVGMRTEETPGSYIDVYPRLGLSMYGGAVTAFVDDASDKMWERIANGRTLLLDDLLAGIRLEEQVDSLTARLVKEIPWPVVGVDVAEGGEFVRVPDSDDGFAGLIDLIFHGLKGL